MGTARVLGMTALAVVVLVISACTPLTHGDPGPPTATIEATPTTNGTAPLTVHFDGSASGSAGLPVSLHLWDFGDGSEPAYGASVDHTFTAAGTFTVTLLVHSDYSPFPGSASVVITVTAENRHLLDRTVA